MIKSKLRRVVTRERRTTMDSRRLDRDAAEQQRQLDQQAEIEPQSDVPRFGKRPSRH